VVERFAGSLRYEHPCRRKTASAARLPEQVGQLLVTCNGGRPHETLGQRTPLSQHREDPHLFQALVLQEP
jgi:hypothetical protein